MSFADARLGRQRHKPPPALTLWHEVALPLGRAHELCGRARRTLALRVAEAAGEGALLWITAQRGADAMNAEGMAGLMSPHDVLFVEAPRAEDALWTAEEALRGGGMPVVVVDLPEPPGMVPVRRLHLAAQAGVAEGRCRPLCLLLTPDEGGAQGIETRWSMDPAHRPGRSCWRIERLRARMSPPRGWWLEDDALRRGPVETQAG